MSFKPKVMSGPDGSAGDGRDRSQHPPSKAGAGPDVDAGRRKTKTEKDLRRVESQYDPDKDRFDPKK